MRYSAFGNRSFTPARQPLRCCILSALLLAFGKLRAQVPADVARLSQQVVPLAAVRAGSGFADLAR